MVGCQCANSKRLQKCEIFGYHSKIQLLGDTNCVVLWAAHDVLKHHCAFKILGTMSPVTVSQHRGNESDYQPIWLVTGWDSIKQHQLHESQLLTAI
jgi:hypothetical protein